VTGYEVRLRRDTQSAGHFWPTSHPRRAALASPGRPMLSSTIALRSGSQKFDSVDQGEARLGAFFDLCRQSSQIPHDGSVDAMQPMC
jgi:hypothetical protein